MLPAEAPAVAPAAAEAPAATAAVLPEAPALILPPIAAMPALGGALATMPALGAATLAPALPALVCPAAPLGVGLLEAPVPAPVPVETPPGWVPGAGVSLPHATHSSRTKHASALGSKKPRREVCMEPQFARSRRVAQTKCAETARSRQADSPQHIKI
jgi:hypothetical protein